MVSGLRFVWLLVGFAAFAAACSGGGTQEADTPRTADAAASPRVAGSVEPVPPGREIRGTFRDPRPSPPGFARHVEPRPAEAFRPGNHADVVLYDIENGIETNLRPGRGPPRVHD